MSKLTRNIILYELNEVPWKVVDYYIDLRPDSNLAKLVECGQSLTTRHNDKFYGLSPWRTWPSLHTSRYDHNSFDLGQDPTTFNGDTLWDVAEQAGLSVGLFGPMQSWPPRTFAHGGFYIPDTFSRDSKTFPESMGRFQKFNLAMTRENGFSADAPLDARTLAVAGVDMLRHGLTVESAKNLCAQTITELRDRRYKARRPVMQALPSFDLYWRLHRKHRPALSIFFTNHVASMMHRFWGDALPGYADQYGYSADEIYSTFLLTAMDYADRQLGRIRKFLATNPDTLLVIAASMGQGPIDKKFADQDGGLFVLSDHEKLVTALGLSHAEAGLAMHPYVSLVFPDENAASVACEPLESVHADGIGRLFPEVRQEGRSVAIRLTYKTDDLNELTAMRTRLTFGKLGVDGQSHATPADLGLTFRTRLGGANTAYHIPEGILLANGAGIEADRSRKEVDVLDVSPSLLANVLRVDPSPKMRGTPSLFA